MAAFILGLLDHLQWLLKLFLFKFYIVVFYFAEPILPLTQDLALTVFSLYWIK